LFGEIRVFFKSGEKAYLEKAEPKFTMKHLSCKKDCFQKLTQFSQDNNVEDVHASNADVFLSRDTYIFK
jgi:hypothetical protein